MHKVTFISLFVFLFLTFTLAQEHKNIPIPESYKQLQDMDSLALEHSVEHAITCLKRTVKNDDKDFADFSADINNQKLFAVTVYEARVLKTLSNLHKVLTLQKNRGLISEDKYKAICQKMIETFREAMLKKPLFDEKS